MEHIEKEFDPEIAALVTQLRTPQTGGRDVIRVNVETNEYELLTDPKKWYSGIKQPSPSKSTPASIFTF